MGTSPDSAYLQRLLDERERLRGLALRIVRDVGRADDVVQETLMRALERRPPARVPLGAWLAGVARRVALHAHRGERRRARREELSRRPEPPVAADELAARVEGQRRLAEAVLALDETWRTVLILRYFEELEPAEIARRLGVPASTVRSRLERGRARLRERLAEEHGSDRGLAMALLSLALPGATDAAGAPGGPPDPAPASGPAAAVPSGALLVTTSTQLAAALAGVAALASFAWFLTRPPQQTELAARPPADAAALIPTASERPGADSVRAAATPGWPVEAGRPADVVPGDTALDPGSLDAIDGFVVGRVVDEAGSPRAGVRVEVRDDRPVSRTFVSADERHALDLATVTDDEGVYRLSVPPRRPLLLSVDRAPFALATARPCFAGERHDFVLVPGARLDVRVEALTGEPLAGVRLHLRPEAASSVLAAWRLTAVSDAAGHARFERLPLEAWSLSAKSAGHAVTSETIEPEAARALQRTLVLRPSAVLVGRVLDRETGLGIPGARVDVAVGRGTLADREGRFRLDGFLPADDTLHGIRASAPGYGVDCRYVELGEPGDSPPITIRLTRGLVARGRVTDERGHPIGAARVLCRTRYSAHPFVAETWLGETLSGQDGRFEIGGLRRGERHQLLVYAPGFGARAREVRGGDGETVELGDVALSSGGAILGRVDGGAPGSEASLVVAEALLGEGSAPPAVALDQTLTASDGSFAIEGLSAGRYRVRVFPWRGGRVDTERAVATRSARVGAGERVDLGAIGTEPNLRGRVTDPAGAPLGDIVVEALQAAPGAPSAATAGPVLAMTITDGDGRFELAVEGEGPFRLRAVDPRTFHAESERAGVLPGERVELRLLENEAPWAIAGVVLLEDGTPIEGAYVHFTHAATGRRLSIVGITDEHGRFEVPGLRPGEYDLRLVDFDGLYEPTAVLGVDAEAGEVVELRVRARE